MSARLDDYTKGLARAIHADLCCHTEADDGSEPDWFAAESCIVAAQAAAEYHRQHPLGCFTEAPPDPAVDMRWP